MSDPSAVTPRPVPQPTPVSEPFWRLLAEGTMTVQRCSSCGSLQHYPRPFCVRCLSTALEWQPVSGRATLYSYTVVRRAASPAFAGDVPYVLGIIELEEGPHVTGNVIGAPIDNLRVGMPLELVIVPVGDGAVLPQWRQRA